MTRLLATLALLAGCTSDPGPPSTALAIATDPDPDGGSDAGTCGNGVADPGEQCCDSVTKANFAAALPGYLTSHPIHTCVPPQTRSNGLVTVTGCDSTCRDGTRGCDFDAVAQDATLAGSALSALYNGVLAVPVTVQTPFGAFTCTTTWSTAASPYGAQVAFPDDGHELSTRVQSSTLSTNVTVTGCLGLASSLWSILRSALEPQVRDALLLSINQTVSSYTAACPY
jgi:hypothetical protein